MRTKTPIIAGAVARHPFRANLPLEEREGEVQAHRWSISLTSVREFLMAYCACFLAVSTFIA